MTPEPDSHSGSGFRGGGEENTAVVGVVREPWESGGVDQRRLRRREGPRGAAAEPRRLPPSSVGGHYTSAAGARAARLFSWVGLAIK